MSKAKDTDNHMSSISDEEWGRIMGDAPENINDYQPGFEGKAANYTEAKANYKVGYKKPPKHTQFKPGQSGNPKGRPKGKTIAESARDHRTMIMRALHVQVPIVENGAELYMPLLEAAYRQTAISAAKGNLAAMKFLDTLTRNNIVDHQAWREQTEADMMALLDLMDKQPERKCEPHANRLLNWAMDALNTDITGELK